jgi:hypothetical protein
METNQVIVLTRFHTSEDGRRFLKSEKEDIMFLTNTIPPTQIQFESSFTTDILIEPTNTSKHL